MPKPEGMSDEEWWDLVDKKARRDTVEREGFEVVAWEPAADDRCQHRRWRKVKRKWGYEPCGGPPAMALRFEGPGGPEPIVTPLCRSCLAAIVKELVDFLGSDDD